jgi:HSP20 family molecular chaperone IbpA
VRGERRDERTEDTDGHGLREVRYGSFRRSFTLPAHVSADAVHASYDAGVLTVRVTAAYAGTTARQITIEAGGADAVTASATPPTGMASSETAEATQV